MLENKRSRVYCFCAVRSYHRSSRSAPKTRSREARTMTEMGLFCTNRSNTSPSMAASLMTKLKKAYRTQDRHTLTPLVFRPTVSPLFTPIAPRNLLLYQSLPASILYRHAIPRRRKDEQRVGTAARGIVE